MPFPVSSLVCVIAVMAEGGREEAAATSDSSPEHLDDYHHLVELGLDARVAGKLEEIFTTGESRLLTKSICSLLHVQHSIFVFR